MNLRALLTLRSIEPDEDAGTLQRYRLFLLAETALAIALTFFRLGEKSIWLDESFSVSFARDLGRMMEHDGNAWLYYGLLSLWRAFGESEFALRSLSALAAAGTVPFTVGIGRRLFNARIGLLAGLILTVNPMFIEFAQEARGYSLMLFLSAAASYWFVRGVLRPRPLHWVLYGVAAGLSVYAHMFAVLTLLAHALSVPLFGLRRVPWQGLLASWAGAVAIAVPLVLLQPGESQIHWLPAVTLKDIYLMYRSLSGADRPLLIVYAVGAAIALAAALRNGPNIPQNLWKNAMPFLWVAIPVLLGFAVSLTLMPVFLPRYYVSCLVPLAILCAAGIGRLPRAVSAAGILLTLLLSARLLAGWYGGEDRKEDWRGVTSYVLARAEKDDVILFYAYMVRQPFEYYIDRLQAERSRLNLPELASGELGKVRGRLSDLPDPDQSLLDGLGARFKRVWLVRAHELPRLGRDREGNVIQEAIERQYQLVETKEFTWIRLQRYDLRLQ